MVIQNGIYGNLKKWLKGHFFGQNTENPQMNIKGIMYVRKISLDIVIPEYLLTLFYQFKCKVRGNFIM